MLKYFLVIIALFAVSACDYTDSDSILADASVPSMRTPELSSLGFLNAIYVERDVEKAKLFVDDPMKEILTHYYIAASVQRHVLNLSLTDVRMEVDEVDIDFFRKTTEDVTVIVKITGLRGGQFWVDDRTLRLNKRKGKWIITEVVPEKRNVNG
ncbi:hypothetical protein L2729_18065 [Shewanella gelidimarina]|uniref:hypothetical protein n=1 Tax=Shewanella gelidimarina TaxID=56813 RepID=UPI00200E8E17|nr:hypothetical protein [Shewanella gelidimarina]MCL1059878.1 hypothetical protein [Shewanella gelidimarina]